MLVKQMNVKELSEKVLLGTRLAVKKLVEETAARNGTLVVADENGAPKNVPAKELLEKVKAFNL